MYSRVYSIQQNQTNQFNQNQTNKKCIKGMDLFFPVLGKQSMILRHRVVLFSTWSHFKKLRLNYQCDHCKELHHLWSAKSERNRLVQKPKPIQPARAVIQTYFLLSKDKIWEHASVTISLLYFSSEKHKTDFLYSDLWHTMQI